MYLNIYDRMLLNVTYMQIFKRLFACLSALLWTSIVGKWRLVKRQDAGMSCPPQLITDFSHDHVVYEFKPDGVLTVTSDTDYYAYFVGDHSYSFIETSEFYGTAYLLETDGRSRALYSISSEQLLIDYQYLDGPSFYFVKIR